MERRNAHQHARGLRSPLLVGKVWRVGEGAQGRHPEGWQFSEGGSEGVARLATNPGSALSETARARPFARVERSHFFATPVACFSTHVVPVERWCDSPLRRGADA